MTQVGKILVLVIMAFSLMFLAISTMVFVTSKNWRTETAKKADEVNKVKKSLADVQAELGKAKKDLEDAVASKNQATAALENRIRTLEDQTKQDLAQITSVREQLATQLQSAKTALDEVESRRKETMLLRDQKSAVEKQANEYQLRQADLNDKIRELERMLDTATRNNSDLRERVAKYTTLLQNNGLSTDISQITGRENPPPVTGQVKKVDPTNKRLEITIGADDGLVVGHELFLYRTKPRAEYLGRGQIIAVDPDQAVVRVLGNTVQGKKIKEGDIVSSTINPRF
jgi:chromosome segregation ATPase